MQMTPVKRWTYACLTGTLDLEGRLCLGLIAWFQFFLAAKLRIKKELPLFRPGSPCTEAACSCPTDRPVESKLVRYSAWCLAYGKTQETEPITIITPTPNAWKALRSQVPFGDKRDVIAFCREAEKEPRRAKISQEGPLAPCIFSGGHTGSLPHGCKVSDMCAFQGLWVGGLGRTKFPQVAGRLWGQRKKRKEIGPAVSYALFLLLRDLV